MTGNLPMAVQGRSSQLAFPQSKCSLDLNPDEVGTDGGLCRVGDCQWGNVSLVCLPGSLLWEKGSIPTQASRMEGHPPDAPWAGAWSGAPLFLLPQAVLWLPCSELGQACDCRSCSSGVQAVVRPPQAQVCSENAVRGPKNRCCKYASVFSKWTEILL